MIKERPIIFSGPMVRAILSGRKSQTRRIIKPQPSENCTGFSPAISGEHWIEQLPVKVPAGMLHPRHGAVDTTISGNSLRCPYAPVGARIWVREAYLVRGAGKIPVYKADLSAVDAAGFGAMYGGWKRSMYMPRWASRIMLEIIKIRVERVQELRETDAVAEGIEPDGPVNRDDLTSCWRNYDPHETAAYWNSPRDSFHSLWSAINGADSWNANPWVWVLEFRRVA